MSDAADHTPSVLVMAGGVGRRLGHLTVATPKPMLPVRGRPFLQGVLERLRDQGVKTVHIAVHYRASVIIDYFGDGTRHGMDLHYIIEPQPRGTAGALGMIDEDHRPVLVINGDVAACVPVNAIAAHHERSGSQITVGYADHQIQVPYGVLEMAGHLVSSVAEKPRVTLAVLAGVYLLAPSIVRHVVRDRRTEMPDLIARAIPRGCVSGYRLPGPWVDIGTADAYARAADIEERLFSPDQSAAAPQDETLPHFVAATTLPAHRLHSA